MKRITVFLSVVLGGLSLAACGAASNAATTSSNPTSTGSASRGSPVAFSRCMRAHGVPNFPDPQGGGLRIEQSQTAGSGASLKVNGVPVSAPAFKDASRACQRYQPTGGPISAAAVAKLRAGALAMARCMRAHGVPNFPDPQVTTGPGGVGVRVRVGGPGVDPNAPAFQTAQRACQSLMGAMLPKVRGGAPTGAGR